MKKKELPTLTLKSLEEFLLKRIKFKEDKARKEGKRPDGIVHDEWEEDGVRYSMWTITTGGHTFSTGDGGFAMYQKALNEIGKRYESKNKPA